MSETLYFSRVAELFTHLEKTSANTEMIRILGEFFQSITPEQGKYVAYLLRGEITPDYEGPEFGLASKLVMRAIAYGKDRDEHQVEELYTKHGDLGTVAGMLAEDTEQERLTLEGVFSELTDIALAHGSGSQEQKITLLSDLVGKATPQEAKYIIRIVLGTLRLGVGDMTFLNGLSTALTGNKKAKRTLEHGFNVLPDIGAITEQAMRDGVDSLAEETPVTGVPVRVMLAGRIQDMSHIFTHIDNAVHVEYKYDGERVQAHIVSSGDVKLFSRRHEDITAQFPDVVADLKESFQGESAIIEGEIVAVDSETGELQTFQKLMQRRRKYDIQTYIEKIPVRVFLFDVLSLNDTSYLDQPLIERKTYLENYFTENSGITYAKYITTSDIEEVESFFSEASEWGAEGVIVKDAQSEYRAGSRGYRWLKFKKDYQNELGDTLDVVVVGAMYGTGRRAGTYGSLLVAVYNPEDDKYYSLTKVGAGFSDAQLGELPKRFNRYKTDRKPESVVTGMTPDVWFEPHEVMEIEGAELTVSPTHTVAENLLPEEHGGLALRFPRFLNWRDDKSKEQATTPREVYEMYSQTNIKREH